MLTRDKLLLASSRRFEDFTIPNDFPVPELAGQTLRCWSMTAREQAALQTGLVDQLTGKPVEGRLLEIKARTFIYTVGDADGQLLFTLDDLESVQDMFCGLVDRVNEIASRLNKCGSPEEISKN